MPYKGKIDKLAMYGYEGKTLSDSEITQLFSEGRAGVSLPVPEQPPLTPPVQPPQPPASGGGESSGSASAGGGGGGGGGNSIGELTLLPSIFLINETQLSNGYHHILKENDKITFLFEGEKHSVTLLRINKEQKEGYFEIKSLPQYAFIKENTTEKFDLTNDTFYDISLTINSFTKDAANITLKSIHESSIAQVPITGNIIADSPPLKENRFYLWLGIAALITLSYYILSKILFKKKA